MKKTPLAIAIQKIQDNEMLNLSDVKMILIDLLPVERECIEGAHTEGMICVHELMKKYLPNMPHAETDSEIAKFKAGETDEKSKDYFTNTYNNPQGGGGE